MTEEIRLIGSLPPIQSAISLDGMGDGARIKIDVPREFVSEVLKLQQLYSGATFEIIIRPDVSGFGK
ncbi:MAG: hypothetical protein ACPLPW_08655 [bacterium]